MLREFVETHEFTKQWQELNLTDADLRRLEAELLREIKLWPVIRGTGSLRKKRFGFRNRSKRDSARVCYVDFEKFAITFLITIYAKNEKDSLTKQECNEIKKVISMIDPNWRKFIMNVYESIMTGLTEALNEVKSRRNSHEQDYKEDVDAEIKARTENYQEALV